MTRRLCPAHDSWMCSMTPRSFSSLWKIWINSQNACGLSLQSHCTNTAKISRSSRKRKGAENITALKMLHYYFCYIWLIYFQFLVIHFIYSDNTNKNIVLSFLIGVLFSWDLKVKCFFFVQLVSTYRVGESMEARFCHRIKNKKNKKSLQDLNA